MRGLDRCRGYQSRQNWKTTPPVAISPPIASTSPRFGNSYWSDETPVGSSASPPNISLLLQFARPPHNARCLHEPYDVAFEFQRSRIHILTGTRRRSVRDGLSSRANSQSHRGRASGVAATPDLRRRSLYRPASVAHAGTCLRRLGFHVAAQAPATRSRGNRPSLDASATPRRSPHDQRNRPR